MESLLATPLRSPSMPPATTRCPTASGSESAAQERRPVDPQDRVEIAVGGDKFITTVATASRCDCLRLPFSGLGKPPPCRAGTWQVSLPDDFDPTVFRTTLSSLRSGVQLRDSDWSLPTDAVEYARQTEMLGIRGLCVASDVDAAAPESGDWFSPQAILRRRAADAKLAGVMLDDMSEAFAVKGYTSWKGGAVGFAPVLECPRKCL